MRLLGVDFGSKRIGIAVGEKEHGITTARNSLAASGTLAKDAQQISAVAESEKADAIVVGVPENLPGKDQRMAKVCSQLVDRIREEGWTVFTVNEAYTSVESVEGLSSVYKPNTVRKRVDGEAARLILELYFNGE
ncbi:MAG TPA: Holliday junction resolvase RuvX [Fimbriimonadaceae bacterium]|jgi:putative transcription antitermination factor YqgF